MSAEGFTVGQEVNNVDLSKIAGLQQKRTLAFVNHFLVTTVQFLNKFTKDCEEKIMQFERKLEKLNASLVLLESKLSSIPEVNDQSQSNAENPGPPKETNSGNQDSNPVDIIEPTPNTDPKRPEGSDAASTSIETRTEETDVPPEYRRFVKMMQVGVPLQAVKLKLTLEGLDATVFDKIVNK